MNWLRYVKRDPVPWLLDPANPSARALTLKYIFGWSTVRIEKEQQSIVEWPAVRQVLKQCTPNHLWGRIDNPYYGGAAGTFGTVYMLAQLGVPRTPEIESACENLLGQGRNLEGRFSPEGETFTPWLCYTGMALRSLWHFGYGDDLRAQSSWRALLEAVLTRPELLQCPLAGGACRSGLVKALAALLSMPVAQRTAPENKAIDSLADNLMNQLYDFKGRDAAWLWPTFPRYYDTDLLEMCYWLAQTSYRKFARYREFLQDLLNLQNAEGRWIKRQMGTMPAVERIHHPSRWLTFEAVYTLMLTYGGNTYAAGRPES